MKKIFASFTAMLREMHDGRVTDEDLAHAYFAFGCTREHALEPWNDETNEIQWFWKDDEAGRLEHTKLVAALLLAEKRNRVFWSNKVTDGVRLHLIGSMARLGLEIIR